MIKSYEGHYHKHLSLLLYENPKTADSYLRVKRRISNSKISLESLWILVHVIFFNEFLKTFLMKLKEKIKFEKP